MNNERRIKAAFFFKRKLRKEKLGSLAVRAEKKAFAFFCLISVRFATSPTATVRQSYGFAAAAGNARS